MVAQVPLVSVSLATVCIESSLYGIFLVLFTLSTYLLATRNLVTRGGPMSGVKAGIALKNPLIIFSFLIAITITAHWLVTCIRLFQAFVIFQGGTAPLLFYAELSQTTEVFKTGVAMTSVIFGDSVIVYRVWTVWGYNKKIIIFPSCMVLGLCVCGVGATYQCSKFQLGQNVFDTALGRWITCDLVFTLCTNIYGSAAIAWKIWTISRSTHKIGGRNLMTAIGVGIESAAIYTVWTVFFFATYHTGSNLQFIAVDCIAPVAGITFMLINVRIGLGWALKVTVPSTQASRTLNASSTAPEEQLVSGDNYPLRPLAISISKAINTDERYDYTSKAYNV